MSPSPFHPSRFPTIQYMRKLFNLSFNSGSMFFLSKSIQISLKKVQKYACRSPEQRDDIKYCTVYATVQNSRTQYSQNYTSSGNICSYKYCTYLQVETGNVYGRLYILHFVIIPKKMLFTIYIHQCQGHPLSLLQINRKPPYGNYLPTIDYKICLDTATRIHGCTITFCPFLSGLSLIKGSEEGLDMNIKWSHNHYMHRD